jgi:dipeptidase
MLFLPMSSHPHQYLLDEYRASVEKLVPLAPLEVREEAEKLYDELAQNEHATERQVRQALIAIGKKEYPYRKAYQALCATDEEKRLEAAAFAKIDPVIAEKIRAVTTHGVHLTDYVKSKLFTSQLEPDEQYHVEQALVAAHEVISRQCDERASERKEKFSLLVAEWSVKRDEIERLIDELRNMATRSHELAGDILGKADAFEDGWSMASHDPQEKEVREALALFATQLEEQSDDDTLNV